MLFRLGILSLALFASSVAAQVCHVTTGWEAMDGAEIKIEQAGKTTPLTVRVADNAGERAAGYQWICEQDANNTAVLFVFPRMIPSAFHMRNVFVPLDIYFFDAAGQQVEAMVMRPEPPGLGIEPRYYQPSGKFQYALEIARPQTHDLDSTPAPMHLMIDSL